MVSCSCVVVMWIASIKVHNNLGLSRLMKFSTYLYLAKYNWHHERPTQMSQLKLKSFIHEFYHKLSVCSLEAQGRLN